MVNEQISNMIKLQEIDTKVATITEKLDMIPKQLDISQKKYNQSLKEYHEIETNINSLKQEMTTISSSVSKEKGLLTLSEKKLSSVKNSKEYEAALKEIDTLKKSLDTDEFKHLELSEQLEELQNNLKELEDKKDTANTELNEEKAELEVETNHLKKDISKLEKVREEFSGKLRKPDLSKYDRIRNARQNKAVAPMTDNTCTGCYMKVTPQQAVDIKKGETFFQCPHCQRFLYYLNEEEKQKE